MATCTQTTRKLTPIDVAADRAKDLLARATPEEQEQFSSVVGSLTWICRSCRPGIAYRTSSLKAVEKKPHVEDLIEANRLVKYVRQTDLYGLTFRPGLSWPKSATDIEICIVAVSDASHAAECEYLDDFDEVEPFRSQGGKFLFFRGQEHREYWRGTGTPDQLREYGPEASG